jgi:hypothetical protein
MITLLVILSIVLAGNFIITMVEYFIFNDYKELPLSQIKEEIACSLHDWVYNHKEEMVCNKCNFLPGVK